MDIEPAYDVLIVKEIEADNKLASGLYVPTEVTDKDSLAKAEVLEAGPGQMNRAGQRIPNDFTKGDIIVYDKMKGLPVTYGGKKFIFINASNVIGKVRLNLN